MDGNSSSIISGDNKQVNRIRVIAAVVGTAVKAAALATGVGAVANVAVVKEMNNQVSRGRGGHG